MVAVCKHCNRAVPGLTLTFLLVACRYRDLVAVENIATLNAAFCDLHMRRCPPSEQLTSVCGAAQQLYLDVKRELREMELSWKCADDFDKCKMWANGANKLLCASPA